MPDITIEGGDGAFGAYVALPASTPAPGLVVAQEIFGVNAVMRGICDWLAGAGYVACCPDLFWRIEPGIQITDKTPAEWERAFELFGLFDVDFDSSSTARDIQLVINDWLFGPVSGFDTDLDDDFFITTNENKPLDEASCEELVDAIKTALSEPESA